MLYVNPWRFIAGYRSGQRCLIFWCQPYGLNPLHSILMKTELISDAQPSDQLHQRLRPDLGHPVKEDDFLRGSSRVVQLVRLQRRRLRKGPPLHELLSEMFKRKCTTAICAASAGNQTGRCNCTWISGRCTDLIWRIAVV